MNNYKPTIGIEIHLELKTNKKVFSPSKNNYNSGVNQNINEIDLAYPGTLPILNEEVVNQAIRACFGLNMNISRIMHFDRKNYFYPDLTKGYQITQAKTPIGYDGFIEIETEEGKKKIGIERIHIEEDTAKSLHHKDKTLLNYNRAGVPLIEIVSKPDMKTSDEAVKYVEKIRETMFYLGVSDCKIEEGSMRCDVNISVSKTEKLGTRSEIKNIGSISNVKEAIEYEIKRQSSLLENGETLKEDTRKFKADTKETVFMRNKDTNSDYRYFPEPDIPYLYLEEDQIENIKNNLEMLPNERRNLYKEKEIPEINIEKLIANKQLSDYLNLFINENIDFKIASNIMLGDISAYLNKTNKNISETKLTKEKFITLVTSLKEEKISSKIFKEILDDYLEREITLDEILKEKGISQVSSNEEEIISLIKEVLSKYQDSVNDYKNGKENALKFLMGMVMKESKGKVNPRLAGELLKKILDDNN